MDTSQFSILYVDDEQHNLNSFKAAFRRHYKILIANSASEALELLKTEIVHLIITDQRMPEMTGVEFLEHALQLYPESIRIILTGFSDVEDIIRAINTGRIYRYITKPWNEQELKMTIDLALESLALKLSNKELQQQALENQLSIESAKFKDQFLANMSHEIRTPMNAITGMTKLLLKRDQDGENLKYLSAIKQAGDNLLVIINDVLDISKIEAGKIDIEKIPFILLDVMEGVRSTMAFKADEKNINLELNTDLSIQQMEGDPTRLNQVLLNLIGNAIKFTDKGKVIVNTKLLKSEVNDQLEFIRFDVIDSGIGIATEKLSSVFDSFSQASSDTTRKYGGTGLGLTISKQLVEMMGGQISVASSLGEGATFSFTIPYKQYLTSNNESTNNKEVDYLVLANELNGIRILLAEDDGFNQIVAIDTLQSLIPNVEIIIAENGKQAVEKVALEKYDLILMDLQMPIMNGYVATQTIRAAGNKIKIMAMTADSFKTDNDKCLESGMNDYLSKPFDEEQLIRKIYSLIKH
jgi:signal transduction histidine kinase